MCWVSFRIDRRGNTMTTKRLYSLCSGNEHCTTTVFPVSPQQPPVNRNLPKIHMRSPLPRTHYWSWTLAFSPTFQCFKWLPSQWKVANNNIRFQQCCYFYRQCANSIKLRLISNKIQFIRKERKKRLFHLPRTHKRSTKHQYSLSVFICVKNGTWTSCSCCSGSRDSLDHH